MGDLSFLYEAGFDQSNQTQAGFDPVPQGWYRVQIKQVEICATKAGTGKYIKLRLDVEGPSHAGRVVFTNINVVNPNQTAQEIGQALFASLLTSAGLSSPKDSAQLIGASVEAQVIVEAAQGDFGPRNGVRSFRKASDGPVRAPAIPTYDDSDIPF